MVRYKLTYVSTWELIRASYTRGTFSAHKSPLINLEFRWNFTKFIRSDEFHQTWWTFPLISLVEKGDDINSFEFYWLFKISYFFQKVNSVLGVKIRPLNNLKIAFFFPSFSSFSWPSVLLQKKGKKRRVLLAC